MTVYLSRLFVDARRTRVRRDLGDCQELHRTLMSAFPQAPAGETGRAHAGVLYRVDSERGQAAVLVQSRLLPDWSTLPGGYLRDDLAEPAAVRDLDAALAGLTEGRRLRFRLRANPTHAVPAPGTTGRFGRGQRRSVLFGPSVADDGLTPEQRCLAWLARKSAGAGFRLASVARSPFFEEEEAGVPDVRVAVEGELHGFRKDAAAGGQNRRLTLSAVLFEGALEVVDAEALRVTVAQGVGPGKAYGCGLLSLARG